MTLSAETYVSNLVHTLLERYPILSSVQDKLKDAHDEMCQALKVGGTLYLCGNGGSAADCEHIAGELLKGFLSHRPLLEKERKKICAVCLGADGEYLGKYLQRGMRVISLVSHPSLNTAMANDVAADLTFAQQLNALGRKGDVLLAISTSGNARNVVLAAQVATSLNMKTIGLTGRDGGRLAEVANVLINVDESETYKVQELHLPVYHTLCAMLERSVLECF